LKKIEVTVRKDQTVEIEEALRQMDLLFTVEPIKIENESCMIISALVPDLFAVD